MTKLRQCLIVLSLLSSLLVTAVSAEVGGGSESGGGGGDPRATEFMAFAGSMVRLITERPDIYQNIDLELLKREISGHRDSLATLKPTLQFLPADSVECFDSPKAGCTRDNGNIDIAGHYWNQATALDRCILTAQELFVHQQGIYETRYSSARYICVRIVNPESITKKVAECMSDQSSLRYCEFINRAVCEVTAGRLQCQTRAEVAQAPSSL
ncbi:MAG: hypothetical protein K0R29_1475 [Pseudobdellovibrio sp.]|nr:hypothetical protein [Pseudobdellovibrio sp.]